MRRDPLPVLDPDGRAAVVSIFQTWAQRKGIEKPNGRHVVRFCADMWVARAFPGDLGIPTIWGVLRAANAFSSKRRKP